MITSEPKHKAEDGQRKKKKERRKKRKRKKGRPEEGESKALGVKVRVV